MPTDPPTPPNLAVLIAAADRVSSDKYEHGPSEGSAASLEAVVGYRFAEHYAVGVHAGISTPLHYHIDAFGNSTGVRNTEDTLPVDLAVAGQLEWQWIALIPWAGVHMTRASYRHDDCTGAMSGNPICDTTNTLTWVASPVVGITAAADMWRTGAGALTLVVGYEVAMDRAVPFNGVETLSYSAVSIGVGFRR